MCSADSWGIGGRDVGSKDELSNFALLIRIALPEVIDGVDIWTPVSTVLYTVLYQGSKCRGSRCPTLFPKLDIWTPVSTVLYTVIPGVQMSGVQMSGVQMSGVQMSGVQMSGVQMSGVQMSDSVMSGIRIQRISMKT